MFSNYLGTHITYKILLGSSTFILLMFVVVKLMWPIFKNLLQVLKSFSTKLYLQ